MTNTEPQGIKDIREAKANYLDALAELRKADAAVRNADAEYRKAETALKQAEAALKQAAVEAAEIAIKVEDAAAQAKIAKIKSDAEVAALEAQKNLAEKQLELEQALRNLAAKSKELTQEEKDVIDRYTDAYSKYIEAVEEVSAKERALYKATYDQDTCTTVEVAKAGYEQEKAAAELKKAIYEEELAINEELSEAQIADYEEWVAKYDALVAENEGFKYDSAEIHKAIALLEYDNGENLEAVKEGVKKMYDEWYGVPTGFSFSFDAALPKVEFVQGGVVNVVETFAEEADSISIVKIEKGKLTINQTDKKGAVEKAIDSLDIIIDALNREKVVVDQLVKDTTGIAALLAKTNAEYKAVKDTLSDGIDAWKGIKAAKEAVKKAEGKPAEARAKYTQDTAKLYAAINKFFKTWNDIARNAGESGVELVTDRKYTDSADIFNAFKSIMVERKNVFGKDTKFVAYGYNQRTGATFKDSIDMVNISYSDLQEGYYDNPATAGGEPRNGFKALLESGFGTSFTDYMEENDGKNYVFPIDVDTFKDDELGTNHFLTTFFGKYWIQEKADGTKEIYEGKVKEENRYANNYPAYADARADSLNANALVLAARKAYYQKFYCTYWGIDSTKLSDIPGFDVEKYEFKKKADSLCVDAFDEKTFTVPTVIVKFTGENFFTPAKGKDGANIEWDNVAYNEGSKKLQIIKTQKIGVDYIKPENSDGKTFGATDYTLYAKTLAVAQFADAAVNYKENTQALAELVELVKSVKATYTNSVAAEASGKAVKDSLYAKYTGKKGFINTSSDEAFKKDLNENWINKDGSFKLAGEQKTLAEKYLADYAKAYSEIVAEGTTIDAKAEANRALAKIYADYIAELAYIQDLTETDPDKVYEEVKKYWGGYDYYDETREEVVHQEGVLDRLQKKIDDCAKEIKKAEANIAKLEAGYDDSQLKIEEAQNDLAEAQAKLEAAEAKLAAAEAAYKQVLANHGITE